MSRLVSTTRRLVRGGRVESGARPVSCCQSRAKNTTRSRGGAEAGRFSLFDARGFLFPPSTSISEASRPVPRIWPSHLVPFLCRDGSCLACSSPSRRVCCVLFLLFFFAHCPRDVSWGRSSPVLGGLCVDKSNCCAGKLCVLPFVLSFCELSRRRSDGRTHNNCDVDAIWVGVGIG